MEFKITLTEESVKEYAEFLGYDEKEIEEGLDTNKSFIETLEHDIESVIDFALQR